MRRYDYVSSQISPINVEGLPASSMIRVAVAACNYKMADVYKLIKV